MCIRDRFDPSGSLVLDDGEDEVKINGTTTDPIVFEGFGGQTWPGISVLEGGFKLTHASLSNARTGLRIAGGTCLLYTSPSPRDRTRSRMPSSA